MKKTKYILQAWGLPVAFCVIMTVSVPNVVCAQTVHLSLGKTQTSTPFRTSEFMFFGNYLLATPKQGWAGELGIEYAFKPKSSFYSSLALYQSGSKQGDYGVMGQDPLFVFNLKNNEYTYNCWSLNTNYNMEVWQAGKFKLMAVAGLHLDRILYSSSAEVDYNLGGSPSTDPLELLVIYGSLRRTNIGYNAGGKLVYAPSRWSYSLNYTYAPRLIKMGKYTKALEDGRDIGLNGFSVQEKVSFVTFGIAYNFKEIE